MPTDPGSGAFTVDLSDVATTAPDSNYLPNGDYDIYNLGDLYNKTLFLGTAQTGNVTDATGGYTGGPKGVSIQSTSVESMMREFAGWSVSDPQSFAAMQQQLYSSGAYGSTKPNFGVWSGSLDSNAMKAAMTGYLGIVNPNDPNPLSFADYLDRRGAQGKSNGIGGGSAGATRAPLQLTDAATLRQTLQSASQNALHRNLSDDELNHFVTAFHGQETQAYNQANAGATYANPDAGAQAIESVQTNHAAEANQALQASYNDKLMSMLGESSD